MSVPRLSKCPDPVSRLRKVSRMAQEILDLLERTAEVPVPEVARYLGKSRKWVVRNFPIIVHGPKSHAVHLRDIEDYQIRRTAGAQ